MIGQLRNTGPWPPPITHAPKPGELIMTAYGPALAYLFVGRQVLARLLPKETGEVRDGRAVVETPARPWVVEPIAATMKIR